MLHASLRRIATTRARVRTRASLRGVGDPGGAERILRAAEDSFRESTYAGVSLRKIGQRAGVSKSLVLYHFESKERIFAELQLRVYRRLASTLAQAARTGADPGERARLAALTGLGIEAAISGSPAELDRGFEGLRAFAALAFNTGRGAEKGGGPT